MSDTPAASAALFLLVSLLVGVCIKTYLKFIPLPYTVLLFIVGMIFSAIAESSEYFYLF